ncbi:MAG TPA: MerR family transcriptional regulator, partial [Pyrinomonadaceae bacterium]|nr:MerR family transcriptional regulator [Pyrinomonadaceae bacterium]
MRDWAGVRFAPHDVKNLFGFSERTLRRWTEAGFIRGTLDCADEFSYDFDALKKIGRVKEMRARGLTIKQIELELQGQLSLFAAPELEESDEFAFFDGLGNYISSRLLEVPIREVTIPAKGLPETVPRLPLTEYLLYLLLPRNERDVVIGDLLEVYGLLLERFSKRHADVWLYKQIVGSIWPFVRRAV